MVEQLSEPLTIDHIDREALKAEGRRICVEGDKELLYYAETGRFRTSLRLYTQRLRQINDALEATG